MSKKMDKDTNALNWFDIAATDIKRATNFYETILDVSLIPVEMMGMKMAMFPSAGENGTVGGAIAQSENHKPSATGTVVYLNANPDLQLVADRIEKAGGKIIMPKMLINEENGYMAFFTDTEGNTIGLHSNN